MSLSVYRDRHYSQGYVYILGSLSARLLKIGTTVNLRQQTNRAKVTEEFVTGCCFIMLWSRKAAELSTTHVES